MKRNLLDRAISVVSPAAGLRRLHARVGLAQAERVFDAAKVGRRTDGWFATGNSANAETGTGLDRVRHRARDLERNNAHAANILRKFPAYLVGFGVQARPMADEDDAPLAAATVKAMRKNWKKFKRHSDLNTGTNFDAQMALSARSVARDGEVLHVWHDMPADSPSPLSLHVLEVDYLDSLKTMRLGPKGNVVIQGVEFDAMGRRVAYWLFDQHPGEVVVGLATNLTSKRVSAEKVDHIFDVLRPGQVRGIPWCAPVALRLRDASEFEEAELIRKKIEACFSVFVKPGADETDGRVGTHAETEATISTNGTSGSRRVERIVPGMINYLRMGEEVSFGEPRQAVGMSDYLKTQWLSVAAGVGMPYSMATGDVSNANYSSQREARLDWWTLLDHWQWNMIAPMSLDPAWRRVHAAYARLGEGPTEIPDAEWAFPKRPWVDPDKDGKATERDLRLGRLTWPQMVAEAGEDPEAQYALHAAWKPRVEAAGFDFGTAKKAAAPGARPGAGDEESDDGADDGADDEKTPKGGEPDEEQEDETDAED